MRAKKSLGQHFLLHIQIARRMITIADITKNDTVVEIGPGTGKLTDAILEKAGKTIALETDEELVRALKEKYASAIKSGLIDIYHQDIRLFKPGDIPVPYVLVANIPYYLTSSILRQFLETNHQPEQIVLLVQKEVAKRITQNKKESILSISVKIFGDPAYEFVVPRGAFFPMPSVDSAVLSIRNIHNPFVTSHNSRTFFSIVRTGFSQKRKKLATNLSILAPANIIQSAFVSANISIDARAEDVSVEKWTTLSQLLSAEISMS